MVCSQLPEVRDQRSEIRDQTSDISKERNYHLQTTTIHTAISHPTSPLLNPDLILHIRAFGPSLEYPFLHAQVRFCVRLLQQLQPGHPHLIYGAYIPEGGFAMLRHPHAGAR